MDASLVGKSYLAIRLGSRNSYLDRRRVWELVWGLENRTWNLVSGLLRVRCVFVSRQKLLQSEFGVVFTKTKNSVGVS